jgi:hypothetical protein
MIDQKEKYREPPEACYIIEGEWGKDTEEEKDERTMGRKISSEND